MSETEQACAHDPDKYQLLFGDNDDDFSDSPRAIICGQCGAVWHVEGAPCGNHPDPSQVSESGPIADYLAESVVRGQPDSARLYAAEELLRAWIDPVNWEDGSAEVEGRLIEGQQALLDHTRAYLADPDAAAQAVREALKAAREALYQELARRGHMSDGAVEAMFDALERLDALGLTT